MNGYQQGEMRSSMNWTYAMFDRVIQVDTEIIKINDRINDGEKERSHKLWIRENVNRGERKEQEISRHVDGRSQ